MSQPTDKLKRAREEVAKIEIGHTEISRRLAWAMIVLFVATVFGVPVAQDVCEIRAGLAEPADAASARPGRLLPRCCDIFRAIPRTWRAIRTGTGGGPRRPGIAGLLRRVTWANDHVLLRDMTDYADALKDDSLLTDALLPPAQRIMTGWLGVGNEQAYLGRDGWLFYRPGVDYVTGPGFLTRRHVRARRDAVKEWQDAPGLEPLAAIVDFARQLNGRGIRLVLMPTPVKPTIHPERLSARYEGRREPVQNASYEQLRRRLPSAVVVFDPAPELMKLKLSEAPPRQLYLKTDTHWLPGTMDFVAERLAAAVRTALAHAGAGPSAAAKHPEQPREITNVGDVAATVQPLVKSTALRDVHAAIGSGAARLGLDGLARAWATDRRALYPPETVTIRRVLDASGKPWRPDKEADVLLLGDSFSNVYSSSEMGWGSSAGLAERLSFHLGRGVDAIVRNDGGACATRELLAGELRAGRDRLAGKRVVVWQFAARELAFGDWKLIELKLSRARSRPAGAASGALALQPGQTARLTGRIAALKRSPRPGTVPYKNHIMPVHLTDVRTADGRVRGAEAVVLVWGLRNNRATPAVRLEVGRRVTVLVRPWQDVESKYETINTDDLDDVDIDVERLWCEELK